MSRKKTSPQNKKQALSSNSLWIGLGVIAFILIGVFLFKPGNSTAAAKLPSEISVSEASTLRDAGAFILDVREPDEWNASHIPGATLIPLGQLAARVNELPQGQKIVVVCRSGNRSAQGRDILLAAGFAQVTSMAGGINEWKAAGLPTQSGP